MRLVLLSLPLLLLASACSTGRGAMGAARSTTEKGMTGAVEQPLQDFNLIRDRIPPVLLRATADPYAMPKDMDCTVIAIELAQLDDALGPDRDVLDPDPSTRADRGGAFVGKSAVNAVRDLTTGWIPFRSWVRYMSGAERNSDNVKNAIQTGMVRRGYLKGVGLSHGCSIGAAAAPHRFPAPPITPSSAR